MLIQLFIGISTVIFASMIHAGVFWYALREGSLLVKWAEHKNNRWMSILTLSTSILWVVFAHILITILWCCVYMAIGMFADLETTLYFVLVTFTTLGFGDILAPVEWQLLSGITASNGLLAFGASTAFQVQYFIKLRSVTYLDKPYL